MGLLTAPTRRLATKTPAVPRPIPRTLTLPNAMPAMHTSATIAMACAVELVW